MPLLELSHISKRFGAILAVDDFSLEIKAGQIVGLMGDNGAGKSTVVKMIAGNYPPTSGSIRLDGKELVMKNPVDARRNGIEIVHQNLALCDNLTASENVFLSRELTWRIGPLRMLDKPAMNRRTGELFRTLKSETRSRDLVAQMSGGQRQAVAIARTMLADAKLVLMDEPTAAVSMRQVAEVLDLMRSLRDRSKAIIFISHRTPDIFAVSDRLVVMRRGKKVANKPISQTSPEEVIGLITGALEQA